MSHGTARVDPLEPRRLLAFVHDAARDALTVVGTDAAETLSLAAHPQLANVLVASDGRDERHVVVNSVGVVNFVALGGDDRILVDRSLVELDQVFGEKDGYELRVWFDAGAGDDRVEIQTLLAVGNLGAGDDVLVADNGRVEVDAGAGDDALVVLGGYDAELDAGPGADRIDLAGEDHELHAGPGDDRVVARAGQSVGTSRLYGDAGRDRFDVRHVRGGRVDGGAGDDFIDARACDRLNASGGPGADVIDLRESYRGFASGDAGNDVLDAHASRYANLYGNDGDDDLYGGVDTQAAKGGAGLDYLVAVDGVFSRDFTEETIDFATAPNTPGYVGRADTGVFPGYAGGRDVGGGGSTGSVMFPGNEMTVLRYELRPLGRLGWAVYAVRETVAYDPDYPADPPGELAPLNLNAAKRRAVKTSGVVKLPEYAGLRFHRAIGNGLVWYEVTRPTVPGELSAHDDALGQRGDIPVWLCVRANSVIARPVAPRFADENGDFSVNSRLTWHDPRSSVGAATALRADYAFTLAGPTSPTYRPSKLVPGAELPALPGAAAGRRGLLVDRGVLWLEADGAAFEAI